MAKIQCGFFHRSNILWYFIEEKDYIDIWMPTIFFSNQEHASPSKALTQLWYRLDDKVFELSEIFILSLSCFMNFERIPNDHHACNMTMQSWKESVSRVALDKAQLLSMTNLGLEEMKEIIVTTDKQQTFDFTLKALEPRPRTFVGRNPYSSIDVEMMIQRSGYSKIRILSSFYLSTAIFSALSLVSYLIDPDQVPGRLGLLVTLSLIMINTYNSVDVPSNRGFSAMEVWMMGMLLPTLVAFAEYACLLFMKRYWLKRLDIFKTLDSVTFILCLLYQVCFHLFSWL